MADVMMKKNSSKYYKNEQCAYFPCHTINEGQNFNCMFCYCPLYGLKDKCGGNFVYNERGIKDCSNCLIPHLEKGYEYILSHSKEIVDLGRR